MPDPYDHGDAWEATHPHWERRLWTDTDLDGDWRVRPLLDNAERYAPRDAVRFRVDVLRLELLSRYGGIYVDCDARPLRSFDPLCERDAFVAQSPNDPRKATNAVMGCEPGHPYIETLLDGVAERAERKKGRRVVESVGGFYLTDTLSDDVEMLPWWWFAAQSIRDRDRGRKPDPRNTKEGFCDHMYGNTRKRR